MPFDFEHSQFQVADGELSYFVSERTTVLLVDPQGEHATQLIQIQMRPNKSDIFAQAPYFPSSEGVLGSFDVEVDAQLGSVIRPAETGITTSHLVKYSHPLDGNAHFSQDGKIYTRIGRQSVRLDTQNGHLFEYHLYHIGRFDSLEPGKERRDRLYLPFALSGPVEAVSVSAEWVSKERLREVARSRGRTIGPLDLLPRSHDGAEYIGCLLGHPNESLVSRSLLAVNLHPIAVPQGITDAMMLMMGGWDANHQTVTAGDRVGLLAMAYPCSDIEALRARLGSIDYKP